MSSHTLLISIDVASKFDGPPDDALLNEVKNRLNEEMRDLVHKHFVGHAEVTGYSAVFEWDPSDEDDDE
ncbi:MAG: hypothetical protein MJE12_25870 [Alphaproteobacteria bacterium]|nr:hypothetical protein [Alphaproteobacteria bacterium]